MLHHLRAEDAVELLFGLREIRKKIRRFGVQAVLPALRDTLGRKIDASGRDTRVPHKLKELAPAAADIENIFTLGEIRLVELDVAPDILFRPPKPLLEPAVVEAERRFRGGRLGRPVVRRVGETPNALPHHAKFVVYHPLVLLPDLLHVAPELLLNIEVRAVERPQKIG